MSSVSLVTTFNDYSDDFIWDPTQKKLFIDFSRSFRDFKTLNNVGLVGEGNITLQQIGAEDRGTAQSVMNAHTAQENPHGQYLLANSLPITKVINGNTTPPQLMNGVAVWFKTVRTSDSDKRNLVVHVTVDGNEPSPPVFSQIIWAHALPVNNVSLVNDTHLSGCYEISTNQKTVRFANLKGGVSVIGGAGLQAGNENVEYRIIILGIP